MPEGLFCQLKRERVRQRGEKQWGTKGGRREGGMVKVSLDEIPLFSLYIKAEPGNRIQRGNLHFHGLLLTLPAAPPSTPSSPPSLSSQTSPPTTNHSPIPPTPFSSTNTAGPLSSTHITLPTVTLSRPLTPTSPPPPSPPLTPFTCSSVELSNSKTSIDRVVVLQKPKLQRKNRDVNDEIMYMAL